jgi:uncharacterized membrane protein YqjE
MSDRAPRFSTPHLFIDAVTQLAGLFSTEIRLARTELSEKVAKAVNALALIAGSVVLLLAALIILLQAAVAWLIADGLAPHWAAIAVGAPVAFIGIGLLLAALNALKVKNLRPDRAIEQVSKDMAVAKEMVR